MAKASGTLHHTELFFAMVVFTIPYTSRGFNIVRLLYYICLKQDWSYLYCFCVQFYDYVHSWKSNTFAIGY